MFYRLQEHEWNFILCSEMIGVCIRPCIYVRVCENTYGGQWSMIGILPLSLPTICFEAKFLIETGAHLRAGQ